MISGVALWVNTSKKARSPASRPAGRPIGGEEYGIPGVISEDIIDSRCLKGMDQGSLYLLLDA